MSFDTIFQLSFLLVAPFWALMVFAPHWRWTKRIIASPWIVAAAALLYTVLVLPGFTQVFSSVSNPDLASIATLLGTEAGATIAWAHFLAFDLFVGRWAYLDSREKNISVWLMAPVLFFTLMLGPLGFLIYLLLREIYPRLISNSSA